MHQFPDKIAFQTWLANNHTSNEGIWLVFDKQKKTTLGPTEALHVALCYGWIDGKIQRIDDRYYKKYFKKRAKQSIWSPLNKGYVESLIASGDMQEAGLAAIKQAKENGKWDEDTRKVHHDESDFMRLLLPYEVAYKQYLAFSPSIQKTYAMSYYQLKKPSSRESRLAVIIKRLEAGLKPM